MHNHTDKQTKLGDLIKARRREIILLCILALILGVAVWKFFYDPAKETVNTSATENEKKLSALLAEIDGVGEAEVMICEDEDGIKSVVVVCEGAKDLRVMMDIREAVAAALGTEEKAVKIYLKKE